MSGADANARHVPVLLNEVIAHLAPAPGGVFIDGTFGLGGYTRAILATGASVIAIDRDPTAIAGGAELVKEAGGRLQLVESRFGELDQVAEELGHASVDGVVLDIGVSSMQLDEAERGFSFRFDGPLDMRMSRSGPSAADVVNQMDPRDLARIISALGEERRAGSVARAIAEDRKIKPYLRTSELAGLVERVVGKKPSDPIHPATRTFQALRIYVNQELDELGDALVAAERILKPGGRLVVVSFHSLEDRIVKRFFAERSEVRAGGSRHMPERTVAAPTFHLIDKGPVLPGDAETARNPRARSAKLRAGIRTEAPSRPFDAEAAGVPSLPEFKAEKP
ncbi:16S rRNA (cytosine(1402)-N(4))-methyltransferase RsmH [Kaistia dalseonensis]|uniref:Ribosomal RNA small subunit methyltransferase H n=1 Tax=Kaistia dalseonensis TaxID=410840 RepID=A0ABU0HBU8_9HYPH|nr:16S rRNA (cytosine(1402)-N(4))-methyltransferase RsmH [Kaistia dalseonensis]MCX5497149.1 16S rRNA (cytosine(1402)-N(4))-methyltransferase RsmH [Kaistia dalseonensis]MDQ0439776.1 16S rRNA (cytosine1402-N4)-methyltransferase [Kaistia dalseonensis]